MQAEKEVNGMEVHHFEIDVMKVLTPHVG